MILIVDDKDENLFSLQKLLQRNNFPVEVANSGDEALKKVLKQDYALIILDVQMPGMDGFEVAEMVKGYSKTRDIPIIFLSAASTEKKFITKGYASGGIDYVTKPVDPDILLLKVQTFYRLFEQNRELQRMQEALQEEIEVRKETQSQLKEKVTELRTILETIPQVAFTADAAGQIEFVNEQWFNYANVNTRMPEVFPGDASFEKEWQHAINLGSSVEIETRLRHQPDGRYRFHLIRIIPVKENNEVLKWVGTFTDIEERKQVEKRKDEFISIASHELKTPLTSIKAYVQLLSRMEAAKPDSTTASFLAKTETQVERLGHLISDLLDISKIQSGKLQFNEKEFDFGEMIANGVETVQQTNPSHVLTIIQNEPVKLYGDEARIEQVLINYLVNAVKYSPDNKEIEVRSFVDGEAVRVEVKDHGIGIAPDQLDGVFGKFFRVEALDHKFQGLGIGLFICAEIISRHGGTYGVESEPGEGSVFHFSIPLNRQ